jgi:hypothetical protein
VSRSIKEAFMGFRAIAMAAVAILLISIASVSFAAQRVVLLEDATSTTCPPCGSAHPTLQAIRNNFGSQIAIVAWHCWWPSPGDDPFYWHNTPPQQTRINYYAINAIPDMCIDGSGAGTSNPPDPFNYSQIASMINARLAIPSPIAFQNVSGILQGSNMNISFDVNVETPTAGTNFKLFVLATEEEIAYNWQGQTHCYDVFRRSNATTGEAIDLSVAGVQSFNRQLPYNAIYNPVGMHGVIFVQNYTTREIVQVVEFPISVPYHFTVAYTTPPVQIGNVNTINNYGGNVRNDGANADTYNVSVSGVPAGWAYSYTTPAGTFSGPSTLPLASGATAPVSFVLNSQGIAGPATVQMTFASQGDPLQVLTLTFRKINGLDVLYVDDDAGELRENAYTASLNAAGVVWDRWSIADWGALTGQNLIDGAATAVVWSCGNSRIYETLTAADQQAIDTYLAAGRHLFINGSEIAYTLCDPASPFYSAQSAAWFTNTLHATYGTDFVFTTTINGVAGDPITDGLTGVQLSNVTYGTGLLDGVQPTDAPEVWNYNNQPYKAGIRTTGTAKVVYFSFPWECLPLATQRDLVMDRIIDYFGVSAAVEEPVAAAPVRSTLAQNSPNPFNPATVIGYELANAGQVELRVYDLNGRMVRELVNASQAAASYQVEWDGRDDLGRQLASGVYFYQLNAPGITETRRMVLAK